MLTQFLKRLIVLLLVAPAIAACAMQNASSNHMRETPAVVADPCIRGTTDVDNYNLCREQESLEPVTREEFEAARAAWEESEEGAAWEKAASESGWGIGSVIDLSPMS